MIKKSHYKKLISLDKRKNEMYQRHLQLLSPGQNTKNDILNTLNEIDLVWQIKESIIYIEDCYPAVI